MLASKLREMGVISDQGLQIGRVVDITFDEKDGRVLSLLVRPLSGDVFKAIPRDAQGLINIPYSAVVSVRDFIVVNEKVLVIQQVRYGSSTTQL
ncbi:MAG: PRC-barrel domain-containing protein [Candidatus Hadarchaeales archaeon]